MKRLLLLCVVALLYVACKEEPKQTTTEIEEPIEVVEDSTLIEVEEEATPEKSISELKNELAAKGFKTFDYVDEKTQDTIIMQQYFIAFLKRGTIRNQNEEEAAILQEEHLAHLQKMYDLGYADISGPFGDDGDIRGITIYNVPTQKMADSLANADPMVQAGRLEIEIHPWWAAKGFPLR
ncbi:YciI family protein [Gaetbulibacter sp. NE]|uniref:YciI family protein n=1 Tax=Gaetbulibacter sp. NE TaxID=2982307 RepID=UPI0021D0D995|nr:YciI family protein [Gaetbulibacter sp. NE]